VFSTAQGSPALGVSSAALGAPLAPVRAWPSIRRIWATRRLALLMHLRPPAGCFHPRLHIGGIDASGDGHLQGIRAFGERFPDQMGWASRELCVTNRQSLLDMLDARACSHKRRKPAPREHPQPA